MRTFIAIEFEEEVKQYLYEIQEIAKTGCKNGNFTPKENFHLTLRFIGDADFDDIERLKEAVFHVSRQSKPFSFALSQLGFFEKGEKKIMWLGIKKSIPLYQLYNGLEKNLSRQGFSRNKQDLSPHITLAREVTLYTSPSVLQKKISMENKTVQVNEISLMKSTREGRKMVYEPIYKAPFPSFSKESIKKV